VELSPEERHKIYLEEKARIEVRQQIEDENKAGNSRVGPLALADADYEQPAKRRAAENAETPAPVKITDSKQLARNRGLAALLLFVVVFGCFAAYCSSNPSSLPEPATSVPNVASIPASQAPTAPTDLSSDSANETAPPPAPPPGFQLREVSQSWDRESSYCILNGEVKNIGNEPLSSVEAVVVWADKDGNVIKTTDDLIDYNPIMPGQTSPFKVLETDNPLIAKEKTSFQIMGGSEISTDYSSVGRP